MALQHLVFSALLELLLSLTTLVLAQNHNQSDFISVDCGYLNESSYIDRTTGIKYTSDANLIDTGVSRSISSKHNVDSSLDKQFLYVRSFPHGGNGTRNCYSFNPSRGDSNNKIAHFKYLIRARFMYGNYDGANSPPQFDIYLGTMLWDTVDLKNSSSSTVVTKELIYPPLLNYIHVCLLNTGRGTPFVSVLEIRPLHGYENDEENLHLLARLDVGSRDGKPIRYPDDVYDRIWEPYGYDSAEFKKMSTSFDINEELMETYAFEPPAPPSAVMRTAVEAANASDNLIFAFPARYIDGSTYIYTVIYVAEIQNHSRQLQFFAGDEIPFAESNITYLRGESHYDESVADVPRVWISASSGSTLPPLVNAVEIYAVKFFSRSETDGQDDQAIINIKRFYGIKKNWQGDPCYPQRYRWEGIQCRDDGSGKFKITSLNLSSSGLTKNITFDIFNLRSLESLDLSNNRLTGDVPSVLSQMQSLKFLSIEGNELSGSIQELIEKSNNRSFTLRYDRNLNLCFGGSCKKRNQNKVVTLVVASLAGAFILAVAAAAAAITFYIFKRRHLVSTSPSKRHFLPNIKTRLGSNNQEFTYAEIVTITNNFERVLGKGAFGTVYHGYVGNTQVAVKMLSPSTQGYQQFQAEANLLTRVHHKCLTSFLGYCYEDANVALIYEYMENGDLAEHLSDKSENFLSWKQRIQIAVDAAKGLEYMHIGCKPPIVHRDIKSRNILLNDKLRGRIGDFGLSKIFPEEGDTHVFTIIAGTPGYVDPQYCVTNRLNEKSDVYSFGVVLLELITGLPAITKNEEKPHITQLVGSMLLEREIGDIMDSRLQGTFEASSAKKALDTAMACVALTSTNRPTMSEVVVELKQCLALEMAHESDNVGCTPNNLTEPNSPWGTSNRLTDVSFGSFSGESSLIR